MQLKKGSFDVMLYGYKANSVKDLVTLWKSGDTENLASTTSFGSAALNSLLTSLEKNTPPKQYEKELFSTANDKWQTMVYNENEGRDGKECSGNLSLFTSLSLYTPRNHKRGWLRKKILRQGT